MLFTSIEFLFRFNPFCMSLGLDFHHFADGIDQILVGLDQCLNIDDSPFSFLGGLDGTDLQGFRILPEQFIGHIGNCCLCLQRLLGMMHSQCKYHLALPQRKGVGQCGLDSFNQEAVIILKQPDLRRHLD